MSFSKEKHLILGITGASGSYAAQILVEKSFWPVTVVISDWARHVMQYEHVDIKYLTEKASCEFQNDDLFAPFSSGSVPTVGMVILPCSVKTLGEIANGTGGNLISRAAHCHLKERRPLIICFRESPLTSIDIDNIKRISDSGGIIMPLCPPFFMLTERSPNDVCMSDILDAFVVRILSLLGQEASATWENAR